MHDAHLLVLCVGQELPVAPVPPVHVHCFVAQARLFEPLQATDSYLLESQAALHVLQDPELKYLLASHDAHLAVLCVGQELPVAPVPPEHVQTFVEQARLRVLVGDVDSY